MIRADVISDYNVWNKKIKDEYSFFNKLIKYFPPKYKFKGKKVRLTILLSKNKDIKKLNNKFRKKNKVTDVLSFPAEKKFNVNRNTYLGDIAISYEFMNRPKNLSDLDFKRNVVKIFVHGFLHLLSFDHIKLRDFKQMQKEEIKIYNSIEKGI